MSRWPEHTRLFLGNLSHSTRKPELRAIFEAYGAVAEVVVHENYGFVQFEDPRCAAAAMAGEKGRSIGGRKMDIEYSTDKRRGITRKEVAGRDRIRSRSRSPLGRDRRRESREDRDRPRYGSPPRDPYRGAIGERPALLPRPDLIPPRDPIHDLPPGIDPLVLLERERDRIHILEEEHRRLTAGLYDRAPPPFMDRGPPPLMDRAPPPMLPPGPDPRDIYNRPGRERYERPPGDLDPRARGPPFDRDRSDPRLYDRERSSRDALGRDGQPPLDSYVPGYDPAPMERTRSLPDNRGDPHERMRERRGRDGYDRGGERGDRYADRGRERSPPRRDSVRDERGGERDGEYGNERKQSEMVPQPAKPKPPFDCALIVLNREQRFYADMVINRIKDAGLDAQMQFLGTSTLVDEVRNLVTLRVPLACIVATHNEAASTVALHLLFKSPPEEHQNVPLEEAVSRLAREHAALHQPPPAPAPVPQPRYDDSSRRPPVSARPPSPRRTYPPRKDSRGRSRSPGRGIHRRQSSPHRRRTPSPPRHGDPRRTERDRMDDRERDRRGSQRDVGVRDDRIELHDRDRRAPYDRERDRDRDYRSHSDRTEIDPYRMQNPSPAAPSSYAASSGPPPPRVADTDAALLQEQARLQANIANLLKQAAGPPAPTHPPQATQVPPTIPTQPVHFPPAPPTMPAPPGVVYPYPYGIPTSGVIPQGVPTVPMQPAYGIVQAPAAAAAAAAPVVAAQQAESQPASRSGSLMQTPQIQKALGDLLKVMQTNPSLFNKTS